jgi:hypothetical protein
VNGIVPRPPGFPRAPHPCFFNERTLAENAFWVGFPNDLNLPRKGSGRRCGNFRSQARLRRKGSALKTDSFLQRLGKIAYSS